VDLSSVPRRLLRWEKGHMGQFSMKILPDTGSRLDGNQHGKTHISVAIARAVIRNGARGRFFNIVDLVNRLEAEVRARRAGFRECRKAACALKASRAGFCQFVSSTWNP